MFCRNDKIIKHAKIYKYTQTVELRNLAEVYRYFIEMKKALNFFEVDKVYKIDYRKIINVL